MTEGYAKGFPVSWDQLHRDARALAWRLAELGPWQSIVAVTRGGLVPATIVARELDIRMIDTVCISSYDHQDQRSAQVLKPVSGDGEGVLIIDDLADTGAHGADRAPKCCRRPTSPAIYTKPAGRGEAHTFVTEVSQDTWIFFPWDTDLQFVPPIAERETAAAGRGAAWTATRLPLPRVDGLSADQRRVYDTIASGPRGTVPALFMALMHNAELADRVQALGALLRYQTSLEPRLSELAILAVARHWSCQYEWHWHAPEAERAGLPHAVIEAIKHRRPPPLSAEDEVTVLRLHLRAANEPSRERRDVREGTQAAGPGGCG